MNVNKQLKEEVVAKILQKINNSKSIIVVNYSKMTVSDFQQLRKLMKEKNVQSKVFKNRLFKIALEKTDFKDLANYLQGQNLFVFGIDDDISAAKILVKYIEEQNVNLSLVAGTYEGKVIGPEEIKEVASLPSYEESLNLLASSMIGPLRYVSIGLNLLIEENHINT